MKQDVPFLLESDYGPAGDQPQAIRELVKGIKEKKKHQVLLGITGSGKTFTMANVIRELQRPSLVIAHNKTLAAQLFNEFKSFFPHNAVEFRQRDLERDLDGVQSSVGGLPLLEGLED